jgi:hypothetical protein
MSIDGTIDPALLQCTSWLEIGDASGYGSKASPLYDLEQVYLPNPEFLAFNAAASTRPRDSSPSEPGPGDYNSIDPTLETIWDSEVMKGQMHP